MSRDLTPLVVEDLSTFSKSLRKQLLSADNPPSHVSLMNMLARASGYRNLQHLKAAQTPREHAPALESKVDQRRLQRCLALFDSTGQMQRWPTKRALQDLSLWVFWADMPARVDLSEKEVNAVLNARHLFGDAAILRRMMVTLGLMQRTLDCSVYRRIEQRPPPEGHALITALADRSKTPPARH